MENSNRILRKWFIVLCAAAGLTNTTFAQTQYTVFTSQTPVRQYSSANTEVGMSFYSSQAGQIIKVRYYKATSEVGSHTGRIWSSGGTLLASVNFAGETSSGWQEAALSPSLSITANTVYVVSYTQNSALSQTDNGLQYAITNGPLSTVVGNNGLYSTTPGAFPTSTYSNSNYFADVSFMSIVDTTAPSVPTGLASSNITWHSFTLSWTASTDNAAVVSYEVFNNDISIGTTSATSIFIAGLTANTTYAFTIKAKDGAGNTSALSNPLSVTTASQPTGALSVPLESGLNYSVLNARAAQQSLAPIHQGLHGIVPFWNASAKEYIYAPTFDFSNVTGAVRYRYSLVNGSNTFTFDTTVPSAALSAIWLQVPTGSCALTVIGLNGSGQSVGTAGTATFNRMPPFAGPYHYPAVRDYKAAMTDGLTVFFNRSDIKGWLTSNQSEQYPTKFIWAIIKGMVRYANLQPSKADSALQIARKAATYLITNASVPAGKPTEYFPYTYDTIITYVDNRSVMMHYPAEGADAYLDLYDATGDTLFFNAAKRIANTYQKLQYPSHVMDSVNGVSCSTYYNGRPASGTWDARIDTAGKPEKILIMPSSILLFLDRCIKQYGLTQYSSMLKAARDWELANPMKDFDWAAQYEDMGASYGSYNNLSYYEPGTLARYLLDNYQDNLSYVNMIDTILRFAEDQFTQWGVSSNTSPSAPVTMEQYGYFEPVTAGCAILMMAYQKQYEVTGDSLALAKTYSWANTLTAVENSCNLLSWNNTTCDGGWINCGIWLALAVLDFSDILENGIAPVQSHTSPRAPDALTAREYRGSALTLFTIDGRMVRRATIDDISALSVRNYAHRLALPAGMYLYRVERKSGKDILGSGAFLVKQ